MKLLELIYTILGICLLILIIPVVIGYFLQIFANVMDLIEKKGNK